MQELLNSNFQAFPTQPVTAPHIESRLSRPALPRRGCREYLRQMRKLREMNLSGARIGNRGARRAHSRTLSFA